MRWPQSVFVFSTAIGLSLATASIGLAEDIAVDLSSKCDAKFVEYEALSDAKHKSFAMRTDGTDCALAHDYGSASSTESAAIAFCRRTGGECKTVELSGGASEEAFAENVRRELLDRLRERSRGASSQKTDVAEYGSWQVTSVTTNSGTRCTVLSKPIKEDSAPSRIGEPEFRVYNEGNDPFVVSSNMQVPLASQTLHYAIIDGSVYPMFNPGNPLILLTYARGPDGSVTTDATTLANRAVTRALFFGTELVVRASSREGATLVDTYELEGFSEALVAAQERCGYG